MNDSEFEQRLAEVKAHPLPPCPASLESGVLRRIRLASSGEASGWEAIWNWMPKPAFAAATLAVALASCLATSAIALQAQRGDAPAAARAALGFDAFNGPLHLPTDR